MLGFDTNPIYALLHEAIYCQHQVSPVFFTFFSFSVIERPFAEFCVVVLWFAPCLALRLDVV